MINNETNSSFETIENYQTLSIEFLKLTKTNKIYF